MILYDLVMEQIEERRRRREARGREIANREWVEWYNRLQAAEDAGEDFTEPNPAEKRNAAAQNDE